MKPKIKFYLPFDLDLMTDKIELSPEEILRIAQEFTEKMQFYAEVVQQMVASGWIFFMEKDSICGMHAEAIGFRELNQQLRAAGLDPLKVSAMTTR